MKRKSILFIIFAAFLLLTMLAIAFAGSPSTAAAQNMPTATPVPLVTPIVSAGTTAGGMGAMNCPMMSGGMAGTGTMSGMASMPGMGSMPMNTTANMGNMGGMTGMNMSGMSSMPGMSNMSPMNDRYVILSDPTTWFAANPWILIGWIVLLVVLLTILAAFGLAVFYLARRIAQNRPAPKA